MTYSLTPYILIAFTLTSSLVGFLAVALEMQILASRNRKKFEELSLKLSYAPAKAPEPDYLPPAARSGLNMNKRVQAIRMFRRNEDVSHIAAALGATRREVELLIRIHKMTAAANLTHIAMAQSAMVHSAMNAQLCTLSVQ